MLKNAKLGRIDALVASKKIMTTEQISYFLQLSDELHYWRTSYKVNVTQSVLSRQIKALEDELQIQLFKRSNRKVELTPAGKFLQQQWRPLVEQLNAAIYYGRKIHQGEGGSVVINHPGSISYDLLPDLLGRLSAVFPDIKVELVQLKHTQEMELMKTFQVDLCYSRHLHSANFLASRLIRRDSLALVVAEGHPVRVESDMTSEALRNERFILSTFTDGESYQLAMGQIFARYGIVPNIVYESDFGSVVMSLVEKGIGVSIMPFSYSLAKYPGVRFIEIPFEIPLYLHWRKDEENGVVRNVLNLMEASNGTA